MHSQSTNATDMSPPPRACRILVVDDEEPIRAIVSDILAEDGYPVATAANGAAALQLVESGQPCVVLLDMRMPVLDGWGFMRALHERDKEPAVLVMTAAQDARRWAEEVGAAGYVAKPFELDEMLDAVERLCTARESEGTRRAP